MSPLVRNTLAGALTAGVALGAAKSYRDYQPPLPAPTVAATAPMQVSPVAPTTRPNVVAKPDAPVRKTAPAASVTASTENDGIAPEVSLRPKPRPHVVPATPEERTAFVQKLLPVIEKQNKTILATRAKLQQIANRSNLTPEQEAFIERHMVAYRVKDRDMETLLARMNVIPPSLVLAQSALESGWGKSRLAREGNALFGQKTTGSRSVDALEDGTRYAAFDDHSAAVASYMRNLNSHPAYKAFRRARNSMIENGDSPSGLELAQHLEDYSTKGADYVKQVVGMIRKNKLDRYDGSS